MAIIKCKMCGGDLTLVEGQSVAECEYCGSMQTVPAADNEKKLTLFSRANKLRAGCDFDKAAGIYESIVADFPEEAEAYWGLVLCKYGIEYVDDPATGKKIPTCHRSSFESVMEDGDLEQALENADAVARKVYREEAKQIEEIRKGIIAVSSNEEPYDIFICYKETDETGSRTLDSVLAQDIYDTLTDKGYRTFFARITLEDKLGMEYEPYIFAALNSAKIMLVVGTDYEYYNAVWVKNEWSRYLKLMAKDKDKHLIPCYKGIDAYDMPKEFARLQAQDLGKVGAMQDLLRGIEKILPKQQTANAIQERVVVGGGPGVESLLRRGQLFLEDSDWKSANEYFDKVLDIEPECAEAYVGKLCAELHYNNISRMAFDSELRAEKSNNLTKALRFGSSELKKSLQDSLAQARDRRTEAQKRAAYNVACTSMEKARTSRDFVAAAEKFKSLTGYSDADAKRETCLRCAGDARQREEAEQEEKRQRKLEYLAAGYTKANAVLASAANAEDYDKAAKMFDELGDYEDARQRKNNALEQAGVLKKAQREKEEEQRRLEQQRKEKAAAELAAKRKKKRRIALVAVLVVIIAAAAGGWFAFSRAYSADCQRVYAAGVEAYQTEDYYTAIDCFAQLVDLPGIPKVSGIEDSKELLISAITTFAVQKIENDEPDAAVELANKLPGSLEEKKIVLYEAYYAAAEGHFEAEEYAEAIKLFTQILDYGDEVERIKECHYLAAEQYLITGEFNHAAYNFEKAGDYSDAADRAVDAHYRYGVSKLEEGWFGTAYDELSVLGDYQDSAVLARYCEAQFLAQENLISAEPILNELPEDLGNVAEMKAQIEVFKRYAGTYTCTKYSAAMYENGVNKRDDSYQIYYSLNVIPKYVQLDTNSPELTLRVWVEGCNEREAVKYTWVMDDMSLFEKKKFDYTVILDEKDGKPTEWDVFAFSNGIIKLETHEDETYTTYEEVRYYTFERVEE